MQAVNGVRQDEPSSSAHSATGVRTPIFLMTETLQTGGTERQFSLAARALRQEFDVHLGCVSRSGSFVEDVGDIPEFPTGNSMFGPTALRSGRALKQHLRDQRVALAHAFDFYTNLMMVRAARAARVPVVIGSQRQLGDLLSPAKRWVQSAAFRLCDAVVCNCQAAADLLRSHGLPASKLVVIPNYVPTEALEEAKPLLPKKAGTVRIGMVARMNHAVKNHPLLLGAFAAAAKKYPVELVLAGDGPLRPGLEQLAGELGIRDRVQFLGDRRDIPAVLASLDIAVLTSDSEALSNAILESMAAGLPVIAARVGGNVELVAEGRTGMLFTPGSAEQLGSALEVLIRSADLRQSQGREGRSVVVANYHMNVVLKQFRTLYETLLKEKGVC